MISAPRAGPVALEQAQAPPSTGRSAVRAIRSDSGCLRRSRSGDRGSPGIAAPTVRGNKPLGETHRLG